MCDVFAMFARTVTVGPILGLILLSNAAGCGHSKKPEIPAPPALVLNATTFAGSPLSGPTTAPASDVTASSALRVNVAWSALQQMPADALLPLDAQSRLTSAPLSSSPLLNVGRDTRAIRFGDGERAQQFAANLHGGGFGTVVAVSNQTAFIVPGATAEFRCAPGGPTTGEMRLITLCVGHLRPRSTSDPATQPTDGMISIGVDAASSESSMDGIARTGQEVAFIDGISLDDQSSFAVLIPCEIADTPWRALAAVVTITRPEGDAESLAAIEQLRKEMSTTAPVPSSRPSISDRPALASAIAAMRRNQGTQPPLLFLATSTNAVIASDFILVADDARMTQMRDEVLANVPAASTPPAEDLRWILDRTALLIMSEPTEKSDPVPEMVSVLVLHTGEPGRHTDSLHEIVKSVGNSADLQARLIGENMIALEDSSPAARVRAFDWLQRQGKAPAGFDPMADRKSRRDAINRALAPAPTAGDAP